MKTTRILFGMIMLFCVSSVDLWSQTINPGNNQKKIEAAKIGFYSKQMNLTPDEAKIFWPLYNTYEQAIQEQKLDRRQNLDDMDRRLKDMSDDEINKLIDSRLLQAENVLKARKNFIQQLRKEQLPPIKVALFFKAEEQFKRALIERVNENVRDKRMPAKPMR